MSHAYKVGQSVRLLPSTFQRAAGTYTILALMPEEHGDCQYRVENTASRQQRMVWESEITAHDRA